LKSNIKPILANHVLTDPMSEVYNK